MIIIIIIKNDSIEEGKKKQKRLVIVELRQNVAISTIWSRIRSEQSVGCIEIKNTSVP